MTEFSASNFNSLIELYIVFNFAYAGTDVFTNILESRVFSSKKKLFDRLDKFASQFDLVKNQIDKIESKKFILISSDESETTKLLGEEKATELKENVNSIKLEFLSKSQERKDEIQKNHVAENFPMLCFFSAFTTLWILIIISVEGYLVSSNDVLNTILVITVAQILLLTPIAIGDILDTEKLPPLGMDKAMLGGLVTIGVSVLVIKIVDIIFWNNLEVLSVLLVIVPPLHFILYLGRFFGVHYWQKNKITELLIEEKNNLNKIQKEVNRINALQKEIDDITRQ